MAAVFAKYREKDGRTDEYIIYKDVQIYFIKFSMSSNVCYKLLAKTNLLFSRLEKRYNI